MSSKNKIRLFKTVGFKITMWYSLSVMVILLIAGSFLYYRLQHKLNKEVNRILLDKGKNILQDILATSLKQDGLNAVIERNASDMRYYKTSIRLFDIEQNTFITSTNFFAPSLKISERSIANAKRGESTLDTIRVEGRKYPYRLLIKPIYHDDSLKYILQVGIYLKPMYKMIENMGENYVELIPALIIFSIVGGWLIARKSLTPIKNINETTREITASNLNMRLISTNTGDELDELAKTINLMLNRLEKSFRRIIQFTSDVSHELRTPIACIKTGTEVILSKERTAKEYRKLHESNLRELENISRMIGDLLILLRSDSGTKNLHLKSFNLGNVLRELQNTFRLISDTKKIYLSTNGTPGIQISGNEILLRRVFSNLLDNAIKYTSPGGRVYVSLEDRGDQAIVRVSDTGTGISEDNIARIFDRFFRVDSSRSRETGGVGLGLSISKNIVELHGGKIEVQSKIGAGSTFMVTLPKNHTSS
ncbi:MAG: heavy metal sensor histidine kinase [Candidatus Scalinduaceae bacterium]